MLASCSVPWLFAPVEIGEREYVDGGVWSPTNLDAVPGRARLTGARAGPDGGGGVDRRCGPRPPLAMSHESAALRGRGATVTTIVPDDACLKAIGPNLMDASRRDAVAAAGYARAGAQRADAA